MNRAQFKQLAGTLVRVRPPVRRLEMDGSSLPPIDDDWSVETRGLAKQAVARLSNLRTMHFIDVFVDSVQEFRMPSIVVKLQFTLFGNEVLREELADRRMAYAPPCGRRIHKRRS